MTSPTPTATARTAAAPGDTGSFPVVGMAEVEPGATADVVAGPTTAVVVGSVDELEPVVVVVVAAVGVVGGGTVVVVVAAVVVVVVGGGNCEAQVWLRLNCPSLARVP